MGPDLLGCSSSGFIFNVFILFIHSFQLRGYSSIYFKWSFTVLSELWWVFHTDFQDVHERKKTEFFPYMPELNHAYSFFNLFLLREGSLNMSALLPETPCLKFALLHAFILGSCPTSHKCSIVGNRKNGCSIKAMCFIYVRKIHQDYELAWLGY